MSSFAQTVTGRIEASELGRTLMHEHILCDLRNPGTAHSTKEWPELKWSNRFRIDYHSNQHQPNMLLDDDEIAASELQYFGKSGGSTIVELTIGGIHPQPERLRDISKKTGINIVIGAGYYVDSYMPPEIRAFDIDAWQSLLTEQLCHGVWGTDIKAGLIGEIGCSWPLEPSEHNHLIAAAQTQAETGAAITIHPGRHPDAPVEIASILEVAGADPKRCVIGHMDRTIFDCDRLVELLQRGFVLEWDFFGIETSQYWMPGVDLDLPTDYMRLDLIHDLMRCGFSGQFAVSHDICTRTRLMNNGGHGYAHMLQNVLPMMERRGWSSKEISGLLVETPARLLGYLENEVA